MKYNLTEAEALENIYEVKQTYSGKKANYQGIIRLPKILVGKKVKLIEVRPEEEKKDGNR